jgi:hypothetical protein
VDGCKDGIQTDAITERSLLTTPSVPVRSSSNVNKLPDFAVQLARGAGNP